MSADELRQAAETLQGLADDAISAIGPASMQTVWAAEHNRYDGETTLISGEFHVGQTYSIQAGDYIATMEPSVGLALANWLEAQAEHVASHDCEAHCAYPDGGPRCRAALDLARLINGGPS